MADGESVGQYRQPDDSKEREADPGAGEPRRGWILEELCRRLRAVLLEEVPSPYEVGKMT